MRVGQAIVDSNAGKPLDKLTLAQGMKLSPTSSLFTRLLSSSQLYGLTSGTVYSESISLDTLGSNYFYPRSESEKSGALALAAVNPPLLKKIYDHFDKNKVPELGMFRNVLARTFGIKAERVNDAAKIILDNARFAGLIQTIQGAEYLNVAKATQGMVAPTLGIPSPPTPLEEEPVQPAVEGEIPQEKEGPEKNRVFIGHSKNEKILGQVKQILEFGGFEPIIAEAMETTAIPVPDKIMEAMHQASAAIIIISADTSTKDEEGKEKFKINENVLVEIGSAFVLYKKKVILLVDKRVSLPSNLQGLYLSYFEGDTLEWEAGMKLQKALIEFKK